MTLHDIENAIAGLTANDLAQFRAWFVDFDSEVWDHQIEQDLQSGKLDAMANEALRAHQEGRTREL